MVASMQASLITHRNLCCNPRLLMLAILKCKDGEFVVMWGIVCSTWISLSRHSTGRHFWVPLGDTSRLPVQEANLLTSRTHM